ncbi:tol-pal system protein YbgF [candidate division GN15 bacterium]|uniref:Tol-pal system protein YbgF n=1 Tax=candidate division GN15 bacterium TaxID=2072418 RepID=A0A855X3N5_9BACT|nr:MAG: tol-pal system protein YbgF [candidate division GN15 bacterium]
MQHYKSYAAAMLVMAVLLVGFMSSGCVTKRDIEGVNERLDSIERQNAETQRLVARLDSVISNGADADRKLRADLSSSVDDLQEQVAKLLQNYADLVDRLDALRRSQVVKLPPTSSPGAEPAPEVGTSTALNVACDRSYDSAFILVRKGQYDKAITGFKNFLDSCPNHQAVANAYYWMGECYYSMEKYQDAVAQFDYLLKNYKNTVNGSRALYKMARAKQELKQKTEAKQLFERLIKDYPSTLEAEQAKDRLKELK